MANRTKPADMARNRNIKGRVGEDEVRGLAFHEVWAVIDLEELGSFTERRAFLGVFAMARLRITAHRTPHANDPPNSHEFYAMLGMFTVAWGRLEGHVVGALIMILGLPEMLTDLPAQLPITWERRLALWTSAFSKVVALQPHRDRAIALMQEITADAKVDRVLAAHGIWDEFVTEQPEPTIKVRTIKPKKRQHKKNTSAVVPLSFEVRDFQISLSLLKTGLDNANALNFRLVEFTDLLKSLRPPPLDARRL